MKSSRPPVCDYEGSDYQDTFWDQGGRIYEDQVEAVALRRLLPAKGDVMLEVGAGAGRNTSRYQNFNRVVLVDYSLTQLQKAQERLGRSDRYIFAAADVYRLPFKKGVFDAATMIRVLHHMSEPLLALQQVRRTLRPQAVFILEYANKQNLKAIFRYALRRQKWNPFSQNAVEFAELNFDFHPKAVRRWLHTSGFELDRQLTVSHFRIEVLKRFVPVRLLIWMDSLVQHTGNWWQLTPSVFARARAVGGESISSTAGLFQCPECNSEHIKEETDCLTCGNCKRKWAVHDGIYDFRESLK